MSVPAVEMMLCMHLLALQSWVQGPTLAVSVAFRRLCRCCHDTRVVHVHIAVCPQKSAGIPAAAADSVTKSLDADMEAERQLAAMVCSINNKDDCLACGA